MTAPVRVVLVEDNDTFRQTLEMLFDLREEIDVIASVATGDEATRAVLAACPTASIVCLSASVTAQEVEEVKAAGAVACVTKDQDFDRLIATVCEAADR